MKNDINLLQKRKAKQYSGKKLGLVVLGIALFGALLYAGITLPSHTLSDAQLNLSELNNELLAQPAVEQELNEKMQLNATLSAQVTELQALSEARSDISLYLDTVENALPTSAYITSLTLSDNLMNISGVAPRDEVLATFALRLRESTVFKDVFINSSTVPDDSKNTVFTLTATLPKTLSGSSLIEDGSNDADTGNDGQAAKTDDTDSNDQTAKTDGTAGEVSK